MGSRKRIKLKLALMLDIKRKCLTRKRTKVEIILDQLQLRKEISRLNAENNEIETRSD